MNIGMVAGEASGDRLGANLLTTLADKTDTLHARGIGGTRMLAQGFDSLYPMERLSVMGFAEVIGRVPELLLQRRRLAQGFIQAPPDVFIGIDAPDYNLGLEHRLHQAGIPVIHYVSPSVWAWREHRVAGIRAAVNRVLCLFPFEVDFYARHDVPATYVGHPLAAQIPLQPDVASARQQLGLEADAPVVALLPGSRMTEVKRLWPLLLQSAARIAAARPGCRFVAPAATERLHSWMQQQATASDVAVQISLRNSLTVMTAADVVCLASGTATLEAMLLKKPAVVTYKVGAISAAIASRYMRTDRYALPNILAGEDLYPEHVQADATATNLAGDVLAFLDDNARRERLVARASELHQALRMPADAAANAVLEALA